LSGIVAAGVIYPVRALRFAYGSVHSKDVFALAFPRHGNIIDHSSTNHISGYCVEIQL